MKRLLVLFLSLLISVFNILMAVPARAAGENLIANPSVETSSNGTTPTGWSTGGWGTNTRSLQYVTDAHTGGKAVKATVSAYTDGDAKWYFAPVSVTAGTEYTFGDYYKSSLPTQLIVQITKQDNTTSYLNLGTVPASASWAQASFDFVAPTGSKSVTVFHVVAGNGWLVVDDASLAVKVVTPPVDPPVDPPTDPEPEPSTNVVPNSSVEQATGSLPASWATGGWGANTRTYAYANEGHTGSKSLKVTVSGYSSGDAKWYFTPVNVEASTEYTFSDYYKSTAASRVVAVSYDASNNPTYLSVGSVLPASASWTKASATVTTPASSKKVTIFHLIEGNGWLQIDDTNLSTGTTTPPVDPPVDPPTDPAPTGNLVANPSFETANGANPASWSANKWGTNAGSLTYLSTGRTGSKSVKTELTSYTNGDAKWYFAPVSVTAGKSYTYGHYYQSNVGTEAVLQYTNTAGAVSYAWLDSIAASAAWKQASFTFTVPAGMTKVSVFHYVASVGWLIIDDASLTENTTPPPPAGLVPNPSLETANGAAPDKWISSSWGTNTPTYQYVNEGRTGTRSVKVTVSNYVDGDAKWYFQPQTTLQAGGTYKFSAWYKTNTTPHVVAMFLMNDGTEKYFGMQNPFPAANSAATWQPYSDTFVVPSGVQSVSVFFFVSNNGWVQTDDYEIVPHQLVGFNRPLVSLTFDDGFEINTQTALPIMTSHGFVSTQCYATQFAEQSQQDILAFRDAGHEICSHTVSHPHLPLLDPTQLNYELEHSQDVLQQMTGEPVDNFASPYGDYNEAVNNAIKQYYRSHRTVDEGYNSKDNFDIYRIRVQNLTPDTTLAEFQSWLDYAEATNTWLVLVYHMIGDSNLEPFDTYTSDFTAQMNALDASNLTVKTYSDALDELTAQL